MGRSRSRSRSPRRGNERERIPVRRSRSRSRERENRRRERDARPERRREPERERPERVERGDRERPPVPRDRRRSRSPSPSGAGRWPRGRSPPGRRLSDSPPPKRHSSTEEVERREIDESQLEGKTESEKEMMKLMGFCDFETTKGKAAEQKNKPDLYPPARKDSEISDWLETSTETRTVVTRGEKPVTDTETRTITISDEKHRKSEERSSPSEAASPVSDSKAEISHLRQTKRQKKREKKLKGKMKHEENVLRASELSDCNSPNVKLIGGSGDTHVVEASEYGKENIAVSNVSLESIPLPPGPPSESKMRSGLIPRSVSLNHVPSKPRSPQTSSHDVSDKPVYVTPKRNPSPRSSSYHVTPGSDRTSDTYTRSPSSFQQDTPKSHYRESPMSRGNRSYEGNRLSEIPDRKQSSVSRFSPATPEQRDGFRSHPATPHTVNRHASYCTKCFEEGHYFRDCRNRKRCRVCRVLGHYPGSSRCEYYTDDPYIIPFQGAGDVLSNFYPCKITVYGKDFHSSEQAYQYKKAIEWNLTSVADQIMAAPTARDVKLLCNWALKGPAGDHEEFKLSVMRDALRAKASQVPAYRDLLMYADPKTAFGEATMDLYWATGLVREETRKTCPERWPGKNTLGKLHKEIAEQLKNGELSTGQSNEHYHEPAKEALNRKDEGSERQLKHTRKRRSSSVSSTFSSSGQVTSSSSDSESDSKSDNSSQSPKKKKQRSSSKGHGRKTKPRKSSISKPSKGCRATSGKKSKGKKSKRKRNSSTSSSSDDGKSKTLAPKSPGLEDVD